MIKIVEKNIKLSDANVNFINQQESSFKKWSKRNHFKGRLEVVVELVNDSKKFQVKIRFISGPMTSFIAVKDDDYNVALRKAFKILRTVLIKKRRKTVSKKRNEQFHNSVKNVSIRDDDLDLTENGL